MNLTWNGNRIFYNTDESRHDSRVLEYGSSESNQTLSGLRSRFFNSLIVNLCISMAKASFLKEGGRRERSEEGSKK